jgi:UDP-glucose 4-epimerase
MKIKKKILITGVAGFIGSSIAKRINKKNYQVLGIDNFSTGKIENIPKEVIFYKLDLSKKNCLKNFPKVDYIMHLAGQSSADKSFNNPLIDLEKNTHTTLNLIEYAIKKNIKKIIYASSMSVYGNTKKIKITENEKTNPDSFYGVSKLSSEKYLSLVSKKIDYVILRMFNVYGPGQNLKDLNQGMVSIYLAQYLSKNKIIVKGTIERIRDFIYINDVVNIWIASLKNNIKNEIFNVGTGTGCSVKTLINLISKNASVKIVNPTRGDQFKIVSNNKKIRKYFKLNNFVSLKLGIEKFKKYGEKQIKN